MILQALKEYYDRKADLPRYGFEMKEIPFVVVLDAQGNPQNLELTYEGDGRERRGKLHLVPKAEKKTSGVMSNLLWENPEYALGVVQDAQKARRIGAQHEAFKKRVSNLGDLEDDGLRAVRKFLSKTDKIQLLKKYPAWKQLVEEGDAVLSFQLLGDPCLVVERPVVKAAIIATLNSTTDPRGICLVTGAKSVIERLHPTIKRVIGAQSSGANIVAVNNEIQNGTNVGKMPAFSSFRKQQGYNSPVGKEVAFAYTTALNHLLGKDSSQRIQVGDASTVFWSEKANSLELQVPSFFNEPPPDDPGRGVRAVESLFKAVRTGAFSPEDARTRFYVLGLAPNASRIAIRFWIVDTVKGMSQTICNHFTDTEIVVPSRDSENWPRWLPLNALLAATANETKYDNKKPNLVRFRDRHYDVKPNLEGDTMRSILEGLPYPQTLLQGAIRRIRAEQEVTYTRAALMKACLNRSTRFTNREQQEVMKVSLDPNNNNIGYRLGRLFAALERIQIEANRGRKLNATIRSRYYGAASSTPVTVFGTLMNKLAPHHLQKLPDGLRVIRKKTLCQIVDGVDARIAFPAHLPLEDQGRFAIGYYHQVQEFEIEQKRGY